MKEMHQHDWDFVIEPKKRLLSFDFAEIWRYRDLYKQYVKRDIVTVYKQTIFGPLCFFFSPIFTTIIYMFVFSSLAGISTGDIPPAVFYMSGNFTDARYMITGMGEMDWVGLLYTALFTFAVLFLGILVFNRQERTFMDTI